MKKLEFKVNGVDHKILVNAHDTLNKVLRENIRLTGTKLGCEQGSCGACTVLVNKKVVQSCIYPALKCHGSNITTIEGVANNNQLHRLQEQFVKHGAIQCGYCTPGMVITALSFVEEYPSPSIQEIKEALSGNLCRCTGYKKIIEAVAEYIQESGKTNKIEKSKYKMVGHPRPYIDATKKVKGEADYADDIMIKNALSCKFLRSTYPHARIKSIDTSKAKKLPGV